MEEKTDKTLSNEELNARFERIEAQQINILTQNVAALTFAIQSLNSVVLALLNDRVQGGDFKVPEWKNKEEAEKAIGKVAEECIKKVNKAYGLGKTNKS